MSTKAKSSLPSRISAKEYRDMMAVKQKTSATGERRTVNRPEEDLHRACIAWADSPDVRSVYPDLEYLFHSPNGGGRSRAEAGVMKACGVRAGVPDLMLTLPSRHFTGMAVELKSPVGRLSDAQSNWLNKLSTGGYLVAVARTLDDFKLVVQTYCGEVTLQVRDNFEIVGRNKS